MRTTSKLAKLLVVLIGNVVHSLGSTEYAKCMSAREIPGGKVFDEDTALTSLQGSAYYKIFLPEAAALKVSLLLLLLRSFVQSCFLVVSCCVF